MKVSEILTQKINETGNFGPADDMSINGPYNMNRIEGPYDISTPNAEQEEDDDDEEPKCPHCDEPYEQSDENPNVYRATCDCEYDEDEQFTMG